MSEQMSWRAWVEDNMHSWLAQSTALQTGARCSGSCCAAARTSSKHGRPSSRNCRVGMRRRPRPPLDRLASPWARPLEAPTVCFRGIADDEEGQDMLKEFSGGPKLGQELLDYFSCCRWEPASQDKARGGTWLELAADFEVATGVNLKPPLYRRRGQKPVTRLERNTSAEQKAYLMHRYVDEIEAQLKMRCGGDRLHPGTALRRVDAFRELGVRWTAGLSHRPSFLGDE